MIKTHLFKSKKRNIKYIKCIKTIKSLFYSIQIENSFNSIILFHLKSIKVGPFEGTLSVPI